MTEVGHPLAEVAKLIPPEVSIDPVRWLSRRLNGKELKGTRLGRIWFMNDAQIAFMLKKYSNDAEVDKRKPEPKPAASETVSVVEGLSQRSRSRLRSA